MPAAGDNARIRNHANLIWGVAELLRGDYKRADYGKTLADLRGGTAGGSGDRGMRRSDEASG